MSSAYSIVTEKNIYHGTSIILSWRFRNVTCNRNSTIHCTAAHTHSVDTRLHMSPRIWTQCVCAVVQYIVYSIQVKMLSVHIQNKRNAHKTEIHNIHWYKEHAILLVLGIIHRVCIIWYSSFVRTLPCFAVPLCVDTNCLYRPVSCNEVEHYIVQRKWWLLSSWWLLSGRASILHFKGDVSEARMVGNVYFGAFAQ